MSTSPTTEIPDAGAENLGKEHPKDRTYIRVGILLAVITGAEVSTYWWPDSVPGWVVGPALIVMMVVKFGMVVAYFMHLRFDAPIFRRVFVFGLSLAVGVYIVTLTSMVFWQDSGTSEFDDPPAEQTTTTTTAGPAG